MKKKNLFLATVIAVLGVSSLVFSRENISGYQFSDLELANIEALTSNENPDYIKLCETHCWNKSGYICYLILNTGATIYCDEMVHWTYFK